jgi:Protein of unknown function (DUF2793)
MTDFTDRLSLPFIIAGQAQKEVTHNEALTSLDALVQSVVVAVAPASVPASPGLGQSWIIGAAPTGAWIGKAGYLACWTSGGWRFAPPFEGMTCWSLADSLSVRRESGAWLKGKLTASAILIGGEQVLGPRGVAIANPSGGTNVDPEARLALDAMLSAMRLHGLIAP